MPMTRPRRVLRAAGRFAAGLARRFAEAPARVHRDQRGSISVLSVFSLLVFTFLLVMVVNVAAHLDDKIKMQNSADAAAHSGGVILARGMNAVAFSNHLLCDVFALTAYLREARDRQSEKITPDILNQWQATAQRFSNAEFDKFKKLGNAIQDKIPKEQKLIAAFSDMNEAASAFALPVFEFVLKQELIPKFETTLIRTVPQLAQQAAAESAIRNGLTRQALQQYPNNPPPKPTDRSKQTAVLWRMQGLPVGFPDENDPMSRTLPVVDPTPTGQDYGGLPDASTYLQEAVLQRQELSKHYLEQWTQDKLALFDNGAELSQFGQLWRIFTCGQLDKLLNEEYPSRNLPFTIRHTSSGMNIKTMQAQGMQTDVNQYLDQNFHFLAVAYRKHLNENGPGLFRNPLTANADALTFTQVRLFLPRPRWFLVGSSTPPPQNLGGAPGFNSGLNLPPQPAQGGSTPQNPIWGQDNWPTHWDALNQNWTVNLVPATNPNIPRILQSNPTNCNCTFNPPELGSATIQVLNQINTH